MKQQSFLKAQNKAHGGILSLNKRRSQRPLNTKQALHVTLRSEFAQGDRSLLRHKNHINSVIKKATKLFNVCVYQQAICGNHLHLLIQGKQRTQMQNFFRVVAGHIAQEILRQFPITKTERDRLEVKAAGGASAFTGDRGQHGTIKKKVCKKNQRKFWQLLIYSRIVSWGKEFKTVAQYIVQNTLQALNIIAYTQRKYQQRKTSRETKREPGPNSS